MKNVRSASATRRLIATRDSAVFAIRAAGNTRPQYRSASILPETCCQSVTSHRAGLVTVDDSAGSGQVAAIRSTERMCCSRPGNASTASWISYESIEPTGSGR